MQGFDFAPLYRSSVGFDRMFNLLDNLSKGESKAPSYPPYNIELTGEDRYRITLAVAGFEQGELEIEAEQNKLSVKGRKANKDADGRYLHRGIATRDFERHFQLADYVNVESARYENGLLHIDLFRELPERMKARSIAISCDEASRITN